LIIAKYGPKLRSSSLLLYELVAYNRVVEAWRKMRRQSPANANISPASLVAPLDICTYDEFGTPSTMIWFEQQEDQ